MILIADFDLFGNVGGGQTAYRAIIERSPNRTFAYFIDREAADAPRPANTVAIPFQRFYRPNVGDLPAELAHFYSDYLEAWQLARSVAEASPGTEFDVVDVPDYRLYGLFLAAALRAHGIRVGLSSIALHGTISSALSSQWPNTSAGPRKLAELRLRERLQYRSAGTRYALSETYAEEWRRASGGHAANRIDPLLISGDLEPMVLPAEGGAPDILFIGRRERRKGPDLCIDIAWMLDRTSYGELKFIGGDAVSEAGVSSDALLQQMADKRGLEISFSQGLPRAQLDVLFRGRSVVLLPSRYDQFNLVTLEALRQGCPVFVSERAGVSDWIRTRLPRLAEHIVFSLSGAREGAAKVRSALKDYGGFRRRLADEIVKADLKADASTLEGMYAPAERVDQKSTDTMVGITARLDSFNRPRELDQPERQSSASSMHPLKRALLESPLRGAIDQIYIAKNRLAARVARPRSAAGQVTLTELRRELSDRSDRALRQIDHARDVEGVRQRLLQRPERTQPEIASKLRATSQEVSDILVSRAHFYRDLARLERIKRGGDIVSATYELRLMRWLGQDSYSRLPFIISALEANGFVREAGVADAMMDRDPEVSFHRCSALMNEQFERNRVMPRHSPEDFAVIDDRRAAAKPRAAVIVSLYSAASKLGGFLDALGEQTLAENGGLEIVLIDSGSPTDEASVAKAFMDKRPDLAVVFARTKQRETIQAAWNRGIALSSAPYLAFLGVDEGLHPDGLRAMAEGLDAEPGVDWIMADSVVTEVSKSGAYVADVMTYDRRGYGQFLVSLETCYLSWVGALYRRSIHERFGGYDSSFRAAGDTEFKSRLISRLKTVHMPKLLGVFNNYPEERTTQHPRAEIEDLRAWYLYRTPAGMAYLFDRLPIGEAEAAFRCCLAYRKSFCGHISTDFDVAHALAVYMARRGENPEFTALALSSTEAMLARIRMLEELSFLLSPEERQYAVAEALAAAKAQEARDCSAFGLASRPRYEIFNDNRYEQHWYSWSTG